MYFSSGLEFLWGSKGTLATPKELLVLENALKGVAETVVTPSFCSDRAQSMACSCSELRLHFTASPAGHSDHVTEFWQMGYKHKVCSSFWETSFGDTWPVPFALLCSILPPVASWRKRARP